MPLYTGRRVRKAIALLVAQTLLFAAPRLISALFARPPGLNESPSCGRFDERSKSVDKSVDAAKESLCGTAAVKISSSSRRGSANEGVERNRRSCQFEDPETHPHPAAPWYPHGWPSDTLNAWIPSLKRIFASASLNTTTSTSTCAPIRDVWVWSSATRATFIARTVTNPRTATTC